mmetsp:Transcript_39008/g.91859  ORF Transcript_39008/g.91859 Transcript_39008/m.91859 type:complete len:221 (-) Transcript_39008:103-765(-)
MSAVNMESQPTILCNGCELHHGDGEVDVRLAPIRKKGHVQACFGLLLQWRFLCLALRLRAPCRGCHPSEPLFSHTPPMKTTPRPAHHLRSVLLESCWVAAHGLHHSSSPLLDQGLILSYACVAGQWGAVTAFPQQWGQGSKVKDTCCLWHSRQQVPPCDGHGPQNLRSCERDGKRFRVARGIRVEACRKVCLLQRINSNGTNVMDPILLECSLYGLPSLL